MFAVNGILFNHESPRRGETFVTRKITRAVARIKAGLDDYVYMGNLDAVRDWGYAPEYVEGMWRMLQADEPDDFVLATGGNFTVRDFVVTAFEHAGLDWEKHVTFDERYLRPTEVDALVGDAGKAERRARAGRPQVQTDAARPDHGRRRHRGAQARGHGPGSTSRRSTAGRCWARADEHGVPPGSARPGRHRRTSPATAAWSAPRSGASCRREGFTDLVGARSAELDLTRPRRRSSTSSPSTSPRYVVLAAAKVGGILANSTYPVDFLSENLRIQLNVMDAALEHGVERLLFLGSSCIYPKLAPQPIPEDSLLTGHLEPTNDAYAIAKIAGILQVQAVRRQYGLPWISAMPTNLYGPGDNFSPHRLARAARADPPLRRGGPRRAQRRSPTGAPGRRGASSCTSTTWPTACLHLLEHYDGPEQVNVGTGRDTTIKEIAEMIADVVGFEGETEWDTSKPDGTPAEAARRQQARGRRLDRADRAAATASGSTVEWYREHVGELRE